MIVKLLGVNEDVAQADVAEFAEGRGHMTEELVQHLPRLAAQWHSEAVRKALEGKVVIEAISAEQLATLEEVVE